ncbi:MAG: tetratricopeptide repeat protein [Pirellula sp.]
MKRQHYKSSRSRMRFHWKLALATLTVAGGLGGAAYWVHALQMESMASEFLIQAADARGEGELQQAIRRLKSYIALHPEDAAAQADLAELIDETSKSHMQRAQAKSVLAAAIGLCDSQPEMAQRSKALRRRLALRHLQFREFHSAMDDVANGASEEPDAQLLRILALCRYAMTIDDVNFTLPASMSIPRWVHQYAMQHCTSALNDALKLNPGDEELTGAMCALLLGGQEKLRGSAYAEESLAECKQHAMEFADRMLQAKPDSRDARLTHYRIVRSISIEQAGHALETAVQKFPGDSQIAFEMGGHLLQSLTQSSIQERTPEALDRLRQAEGYFRASLREAPRIPATTARVLGTVLYFSGRVDEALSMWRSGLEDQPNDPSLHFHIASACIEQKDWARAESALRTMDLAIARGSAAWSESQAEAIEMEAKGRWAMYHSQRGEYEAVIRVLEPYAALKTQLSPEFQAVNHRLLGQAYFATRILDKAAERFEEAFKLAPHKEAIMQQAANAWLEAGRPDKALQCEQAIKAKTISDWYIVAKSTLAQYQAGLSTPEHWRLFDEAIATSRSGMKSGSEEDAWKWRFQWLELDARVVRAPATAKAETRQEVARALVELCHEHPNVAPLQRDSMARLTAWGERDAIAELEKAMSQQRSKLPPTLMEQVSELVRNDQKDAARVLLLQHLQSPQATQSEEDLSKIPGMALKLCGEYADYASTHRDLVQWAGDSLVRNRIVAYSMLDIAPAWFRSPAGPSGASRESDAAIDSWNRALEVVENKLQMLEGETGTEWKAVRALRLLEVESRRSSSEQLQEVDSIAHSLETHRPQWDVTYQVLGRLAERRGDSTIAAKHYDHAIACGASELGVYDRLVAIWVREGKLDAAREVLLRIGAWAGKSPKLEDAAFQLLTMSEEEAMALAELGVQSRPNDPVAWTYLGLASQRAPKEQPIADRETRMAQAHQAFERANQLHATQSVDAMQSAKVLSSLRVYYQSIRDSKKLTELHDHIQKMESLEEATRWELLGSYEKALGRYSGAAESYRRAMQAGADRMEATLQCCDAWMHARNFHDAIEALETLVREFPESRPARHALANALFETGDWDRIEKVLLESKHGNQDADRRLLAMLRCRRGTPADIERALLLYDASSRGDARVSADDALMLASILSKQIELKLGKYTHSAEREEGIKLANRYFLQALSEDDRNSGVLSAYLEFLVDTKQFLEANRRLSELRKLEPDARLLAVLEARLHQGQGKLAEARHTLEAWREERLRSLGPRSGDGDRLVVDGELAINYLMIDDVVAAQPLIDSIRVQAPALAARLLEQGCRMPGSESRRFSIGKWMDWEDQEPDPRRALPWILTVRGAMAFDAQTQQRIDARLQRYAIQYESQPLILRALGDLWLERDAVDKAIAMYRKALVVEPNDIALLNNVACLVAEATGSAEEAMPMIDRAIELGGRLPELIDSKGYILTIAGRHEEAVPYFEDAAKRGTDPRAGLHWYMALKRSGRAEEAMRVGLRIDAESFKGLHLSAEEKRELEQLAASAKDLRPPVEMGASTER